MAAILDMYIDLQPILTGGHVILRPLVDSDFEPLYDAASDTLIWEQHQDKKRHTREGFSQFFKESMASAGALCILEIEDNNVIGSSRFKIIDQAEGIVEIGWTFLKRNYWGGSYNREVKQLMINHALKYFRKVVFYVNKKNTRSQKALEKIGAIRTFEYGLSWVIDQQDGLTYLISKEIH